MSLYSVALFLHVVAAFGLMMAMGLEWVLVVRLRHADTAQQAGDWLNLLPVIRVISPLSVVVLLVAGFYMASAWQGAAWVVVAFVTLLLIAAFGAITGRRLPGIARDLANHNGPLAAGVREQLRSPLLLASVQIRTTMVLGIAFLMTTKPDLIVSVITIVVAALVGAAFSVQSINKVAVVRNEAAQ
jgi:hypothetical protein